MAEMNDQEKNPFRLNSTHIPHYPPPALHIVTSSRQSSCSIKSTPESLNDFLDLYADDTSSIDVSSITPSIREQTTQASSFPTAAKHVIGSPGDKSLHDRLSSTFENPKPREVSCEIAASNTPEYQVTESSGFNTVSSPADLTITPQPDSTIISGVENIMTNGSSYGNEMNETLSSFQKPHTYTYSFDEGDDDDLGIDESILNMINSLGNEMDPEQELEIELSPEIIDQIHRNKTLRHKSTSTSTLSNLDFLPIDIQSEDADYDDPDRFKTFFGLDSAASSSEYEDSCELIPEEEEEEEESPEIENREITAEQIPNNETIDDQDSELVNNLDISPIPESDENQKNIQLASDANMPDDPPPYCEVDELEIKRVQEQQDEEMALRLQSEEYGNTNTSSAELALEAQDHLSDIVTSPVKPKTSNVGSSLLSNVSPSSSTAQHPTSAFSSPLKRKISIKLKKNKDGELSRHASVDYYHLDRYLPPYRSLINPTKAFDYRTNSYIDTTDNDIEIKSGADNKPIVAIHKKRRDSKLMSILLTTNNSIKQKLIDVANDTQSIKSRSISVKSLSSITHSTHSEVKSKPTALFNDLPQEMHQLIINHVDNQRDLVNCLYVSKAFKSYAIPNLYRFPRFTSSYRLGQFVHTILNYPVYAPYVKVLDLSKITFPVLLTDSEKAKYQDKLVYGSSAAMEILNDKKRVVYAGWRDWKYRNHPLYGNFDRWRKRAKSVSTMPPSGSPAIQWDLTASKNMSAPNLLDPKKFTSTMTTSTMMVNSTRSRSHSGSENTMKRGPNKARSRSNSASNHTTNSNNNSSTKLNGMGSSSNRNSYNGANHGSNVGTGGGSNVNHGRGNKQSDNGSFVKSFKKAFGLEPVVAPKKRRGASPVRKPLARGSFSSGSVPTLTQKKPVLSSTATATATMTTTGDGGSQSRSRANSNKSGNDGNEPEYKKEEIEPFGTPHPRMNTLLKQYCFNRDIPVGYIIHILNECANLEELNLSNVVVSTDYELKDYASFDWYTGNGEMVVRPKSPVVLDPARPIFWSDSGRDMDLTDSTFLQHFAESVEFKAVWKHVYNMRRLQKLVLSRINSLEMSIIEGFVMKSQFRESLRYLDCSKSGMVKRSEWDEMKSAQDWRRYFRSKPS